MKHTGKHRKKESMGCHRKKSIQSYNCQINTEKRKYIELKLSDRHREKKIYRAEKEIKPRAELKLSDKQRKKSIYRAETDR